MTPIPTMGESVRTARFPEAVELALAIAELTALEAAAICEVSAELTSLQISEAREVSSAR